MIITEDFVFLHLQKTGGTFCATHIERLYKQSHRERFRNLLRRKPVHWYRFLDKRKHFGVHSLPRYARFLPKLTCIRNPYDRWVSHYEFKIYKYYPHVVPNLECILNEYPHFPEVTLTEFISLVNRHYTTVQNRLGKDEDEKLGFYSALFIRMTCPRPGKVLALPRKEITADLVRGHMTPNITFLETGDLSGQLHRYLAQFNHQPDALETILTSPKILPDKSGPGSLRPEGAWRAYYTEEALDLVTEKEALIFDLFPQFKRESYHDWQRVKDSESRVAT